MLVTTALDELEASGALRHSNQMDIAELLNPAIETRTSLNIVFGATDEDIYNRVMRGQKFEGARWTW